MTRKFLHVLTREGSYTITGKRYHSALKQFPGGHTFHVSDRSFPHSN